MEAFLILLSLGITGLLIYAMSKRNQFNLNRKDPDKGGLVDNPESGHEDDGNGGE